MTVPLEHLTWNDSRSIVDVAASAKERGVCYLILSQSIDATFQDLVEDSIRQHPSSDVLVFVDPRHPARKLYFREALPPVLSLIAATPNQDRAVAFSTQALQNGDRIGRSQSWAELVVKLAETATVAFVDALVNRDQAPPSMPSLTAPATPPHARWLRDFIPRMVVSNAKAKTLTALQAGLFLLADFFDESHSCSQSIEGEGRFHTGDYWHAILHRREPDYGNSKYWFRHVGRHPIFAELASAVSDLPAPAGKSAQFQAQVGKNGEWDPFAFVDLCAAAENDRELKAWCEAVQYAEMLLLLEHSYREVSGSE